MLAPLALSLWLATAPAPDYLDVRPSGGDQQVLATGGLVYRWAGRGSLRLEAQLGAPMAALHPCDAQRSIAVGLRGSARVSTSGLGWRPVVLEGARDLWAVASADCGRVLVVGDGGGLWEGSVEQAPARFTRLPSPTSLPLYGVAAERGRAVAVGAGGTVLVRRAEGGPFTALESGTELPLLAVALTGAERFVVAGAGGLWLGEGERLRPVVTDETEVFTRVVFADRHVGVALGQEAVLTTTDGGETWRRQALEGALGAAALPGGRFLVVGRGGLWRIIETLSPPSAASAPVRVPQRLLPEPPPEKPAPRKPEPPPAPAVAEVRPLPPAPPPAQDDAACQPDFQRKHMSVGFTDLRVAAGGVFVSSGDGTVRRVEGDTLPVAHTTGEPMLGMAVSLDGHALTATGWGVLARSRDGGRTWRTEKAPSEAIFFAAVHTGDALLVFDAKGRGWRARGEGPFEPLALPRRVTFYGAAFADVERGYVAGHCGTLLETRDGGTTWRVLSTPFTQDISSVLAYRDTVLLSGREGVFRSDDQGRTFTPVLEGKLGCVRLARRGSEVAVACHRGLHHAPDGRTFTRVPVPYQLGLLAAGFLPSGELGAVGMAEQFIRAQPSGGRIVNRSPAVERWLARAKQLQLDLDRPAPRNPPRTVRVAEAPAAPR